MLTMGFQEHAPVHGTCAVPPLLEPHHESRVRHLQRLKYRGAARCRGAVHPRAPWSSRPLAWSAVHQPPVLGV